jgi:4-aminobutyrate aminotransferase-like enzyme
VVKIVNSEENPEDEEPDCICSGLLNKELTLRVKDKNDETFEIFMALFFVTSQVKTFMALCASSSS